MTDSNSNFGPSQYLTAPAIVMFIVYVYCLFAYVYFVRFLGSTGIIGILVKI